MTTVPDFMPDIRSGYHASPKAGGCVMQVTNYLWNEGWSDRPDCTESGIAGIAISVNDSVGQAARRGLLAAVPDLIGTAWLAEGMSESEEDAAIDALSAWVDKTFPYGMSIADVDCDENYDTRWANLTDRIQTSISFATALSGNIPDLAYYENACHPHMEKEIVEAIFGADTAQCVANAPTDWRERQVELVAWFVAFVAKYRELFGGAGQPVELIDVSDWRKVADVMTAPA